MQFLNQVIKQQSAQEFSATILTDELIDSMPIGEDLWEGKNRRLNLILNFVIFERYIFSLC